MILIDAIYIHELGGKLLLQYFIEEVEKKFLKNFYFLLDERVKLKFLPSNFEFLEASEINRKFFYLRNRKNFEKIFCFSNVPPPYDTKVETFVYFHNHLLLETKNTKINLITKLNFLLKRIYIKYVNIKEYNWIVQTEYLKSRVKKTFKIDSKKIFVLPFYYDDFKKIGVKKKANSFIYVSGFLPHKNHFNLIKAFINVSKIFNHEITLNLTLNEKDFNFLTTSIKTLPFNLKIENLGVLDIEQINIAYEKNQNLIFPSLNESFGLPLIEASIKGLNVICSNLDYVNEVIKPSLTFNPLDVDDISNSILKTLTLDNIDKTELISKNKIHEIIKLLSGV